MDNVVIFEGGRPEHETASELAARVQDLVYEYANRISLASAIGVLEIVKFEIMREQEPE